MRWFITAYVCIGLLALVGCGGGSDPNCGPGTHEENGQCVPDKNTPDTTEPDISVPDTTAPDTTAPDAAVPDTTEPDTIDPCQS
jgi:hypothetical protein